MPKSKKTSKKTQKQDRGFFNLLRSFLSSQSLLTLILIIFTLGSVWVAFSLVYPTVFDEHYHFNVIQVFSDQWLPIVTAELPPELHFLRDIRYEDASLYHYIYGMLLKLILFIAPDLPETHQVVSLRLLNIPLVILGLIGFSKLFKKIQINPIVSNFIILIFATMPLFLHVSGAINYDNLVFAITPFFFMSLISLIKAKKESLSQYLIFASLVMGLGLAKFSLLPLALFGTLALIIAKVYQYRKNTLKEATKAIKNFNYKKLSSVAIAVIFLILFTLFTYKYIGNYIRFGTIRPSCDITMGHDKCMSSPIYERNYEARQSLEAGETKVDTPDVYLVNYFQSIMHQYSGWFVARNGDDAPVRVEADAPYIYRMFIWFFIIFGLVFLVATLKDLFLYNKVAFLIVGLAVLQILVTAYFVFTGYYFRTGGYFAIQARYTLVVLPIVLALGYDGFFRYLGGLLKSQKIKDASLVVGLLAVITVLSQGSGVFGFISPGHPDWFRQGSPVRQVNEALKGYSDRFIQGNNPDFGFY